MTLTMSISAPCRILICSDICVFCTLFLDGMPLSYYVHITHIEGADDRRFYGRRFDLWRRRGRPHARNRPRTAGNILPPDREDARSFPWFAWQRHPAANAINLRGPG